MRNMRLKERYDSPSVSAVEPGWEGPSAAPRAYLQTPKAASPCSIAHELILGTLAVFGFFNWEPS